MTTLKLACFRKIRSISPAKNHDCKILPTTEALFSSCSFLIIVTQLLMLLTVLKIFSYNGSLKGSDNSGTQPRKRAPLPFGFVSMFNQFLKPSLYTVSTSYPPYDDWDRVKMSCKNDWVIRRIDWVLSCRLKSILIIE